MSLYKRTAWFALALALLLSAFAVRMQVDNRIECWVHPPEIERMRYAGFKQTFGGDEFILIAYTGRPIFDVPALEVQLAALDGLEAVEGVLRIDGIPAVYRDRFGQEDADALAEEFTSTPFYRRFLINDDATVAAMLVGVSPPPSAQGRRDLVRELEAASKPLREFGYSVHMAGPPLLNAVLDEASQNEAVRSFPPALIVSLLLLLILLRSWRATLAAAICATLTVTATLGVMGLAGQPMTMVTSALPALLWVLSLAASVHVVNRYQAHLGEGRRHDETIRLTLREVVRPSVLAGATTAAGFLSLVLAALAPVRGLGAFAAIGVSIASALSLLVCPLLLHILYAKRPEAAFRPAGSPRMTWLSAFVQRRYRSIIATGIALGAACVAAVPHITFESDPLTFLPAGDTTVQDYAFIGRELTGFYSLELVLHLDSNWADPTQWPMIEGIVSELSLQPGVARVLSPLDVLRKLRQWNNGLDPAAYGLPRNATEAHALLEGLSEEDSAVLVRFVDNTGKNVRLSVLINEMNSTAFTAIVAQAEAALARLPKPAHGYPTGIVLQLVDSQLALVRAQVRSFAAAFLVIFACIAAGLRSARLAVLAIPPNVLPILAVLALMAVFGVPLDAGTVMVASVALGIAVDDTIHVLAGIQRARRCGATPHEAVSSALSRSGPALIYTTALAGAGFAMLLRSQFVPIAWFGLFSALAIAVALAADLFLTPGLYLACARTVTPVGEAKLTNP